MSGPDHRHNDRADTNGGIFAEVRPSQAGGFSALLTHQIERKQADGDKLWQSGREILLRFSHPQFSTGNWVWTRGDWEKYIRDGKI